MENTDYEKERLKTIAENRKLLKTLGFDDGGAARLNIAPPTPLTTASSRKRRAPPVKIEPDGPRRRSGRIAGVEADGQTMAAKVEAEEKQAEEQRIVNRKIRDQVMDLKDMVEDTPARLVPELEAFLPTIAEKVNARVYPTSKTTGKEAFGEKDPAPEVERLQEALSKVVLRANVKVTTERVFSMVVHPEPTKSLVFVGDKYGQLGIWDALGPGPAGAGEDDDDDEKIDDDGTGRVWRVQAHARNSITCMKVDPAAGSSLVTSSYDCSLRSIDFNTLKSTELFAFDDEDMLVTHFDLTPGGREAWIVDTHGGISHCDFRESGNERRRWEVQVKGKRSSKLGGISVNPLMPYLLCTAGNDQHVRIWDARHLSKMAPRAVDKLDPPPKSEDGVDRLPTYPTSSIPDDRIEEFAKTKSFQGLQRASYQHGKSCSAAYWDPWGRRIVTTSYDDKLRVWDLKPASFMFDSPLPASQFQPSSVVRHDCQTGRWLTILRAQWSLNTEYFPHYTVGNMKRRLDVFTASGERVAHLWAEGVTAVPAVTASHPSHVDRLVGGNTSGRVQLWAPAD